MHRFSTMKTFLLLALIGPLFAACSEDSTGPDGVSFPVVMNPTGIGNKSEIRAFVREGGTWREITSSNPDILSDEFFAEETVYNPMDHIAFRFTSSTQWEAVNPPSASISYSYSDNTFTFASPTGLNAKAYGDYSKLGFARIAGVSISEFRHETSSLNFEYDWDPIETLTSGIFPLPVDDGDTLAYQTFEVIYEAQ